MEKHFGTSHTAGGNVNYYAAASSKQKKVKQLAYDSATLLYKTKSIPEILFSCEKESGTETGYNMNLENTALSERS